jgi:hypothetical protein
MKPTLKEVMAMSSEDFITLIDTRLEAAAIDRERAVRNLEARQVRALEALSNGKRVEGDKEPMPD